MKAASELNVDHKIIKLKFYLKYTVIIIDNKTKPQTENIHNIKY